MKGTCMSSYRSKGGTKMFIFKVTGTDAEIEKYLEVQKERFPEGKWEDDDGVYYWTQSPSGRVIDLVITTNGNVVEDTTNIDLEASSRARYDVTYETVKNRLSGQQTVSVRSTPVVKTPAETPPVPSGTGLDQD